MESDHVRVIFTIPACETMECLVKEWSMGAFSENQILLGMVRVVNVGRVLKKAAYGIFINLYCRIFIIVSKFKSRSK